MSILKDNRVREGIKILLGLDNINGSEVALSNRAVGKGYRPYSIFVNVASIVEERTIGEDASREELEILKICNVVG